MTSDRTIRPVDPNAGKKSESSRAGNAVLSAPERAAWLEAVEPERKDRERLRAALALALASGSISTTAHAVDSAMAGYATPLARRALSGFGLKLAASTILVAGALLGAFLAWRSGSSAPDRHAGVETPTPGAAPAAYGGGYQPLHPTDAKPLDMPAASLQSALAPAPEASASAPMARKRAVPGTRTTAKNEPQRSAEPRSEPQATDGSATSRQPLLDLAEELTLLRQASTALMRHDPTTALHWLSEHATRFPRGAMAKEADALHVMVLCEQHDEHASAQRDAFLRAEPSSPVSERVRQACSALP